MKSRDNKKINQVLTYWAIIETMWTRGERVFCAAAVVGKGLPIHTFYILFLSSHGLSPEDPNL